MADQPMFSLILARSILPYCVDFFFFFFSYRHLTSIWHHGVLGVCAVLMLRLIRTEWLCEFDGHSRRIIQGGSAKPRSREKRANNSGTWSWSWTMGGDGRKPGCREDEPVEVTLLSVWLKIGLGLAGPNAGSGGCLVPLHLGVPGLWAQAMPLPAITESISETLKSPRLHDSDHRSPSSSVAVQLFIGFFSPGRRRTRFTHIHAPDGPSEKNTSHEVNARRLTIPTSRRRGA